MKHDFYSFSNRREAVFSACSVQSGHKQLSVEKSLLNFETPACQDMSFGAEE
jgi:hypothetical protein